jgi:hypothetical protein
MQPHDWLWLLPVAASAYNAWQNKSIQTAILTLNLALSNQIGATREALTDRIAKAEADIKELRAIVRGHSQ